MKRLEIEGGKVGGKERENKRERMRERDLQTVTITLILFSIRSFTKVRRILETFLVGLVRKL